MRARSTADVEVPGAAAGAAEARLGDEWIGPSVTVEIDGALDAQLSVRVGTESVVCVGLRIDAGAGKRVFDRFFRGLRRDVGRRGTAGRGPHAEDDQRMTHPDQSRLLGPSWRRALDAPH